MALPNVFDTFNFESANSAGETRAGMIESFNSGLLIIREVKNTQTNGA
jgi:hypothetical protein